LRFRKLLILENPTLQMSKGVSLMKTRFCALLLGASLFALASAANAGQPLSDSQMDGVTAGMGSWAAFGATAAVAVGNFDANTTVILNTYTSQVENVAISEGFASGNASSAITTSILAVGSSSTATCANCGG
jgi:hypothetical protein